ncbi:MFS transporter [Phormidium sp. CLA17]|uniref:MFS transporter n=1 Tax=Leptolyngbya sp. Cla-17 TaxID=2803751 RepID=UPI0014931BE4|nr:MFS transporter [Leptolyngbya sp. Cla-17]MBM0740343.1 MFS transporter [Leptolyngbya sp. Cla-17]
MSEPETSSCVEGPVTVDLELTTILSKNESDSHVLSLTIPISKAQIRTSLQASTVDGIFATIFTNATGGVLLSNFLVGLNASPSQIGLLSSIPMLANLMQPLGALWSDRVGSYHWYCFWIYVPSRLLWLILAAAIFWAGQWNEPTWVNLTLTIVGLTYFLAALGSASWLSWLATLVPSKLRGSYFGTRASAMSLMNLLSIPVLGWIVSAWGGGAQQGYGVVVLLGVIAGIISLGFQFWMADVSPRDRQTNQRIEHTTVFDSNVIDLAPQEFVNRAVPESPTSIPLISQFFQNTNFLLFLLYFALWMFAVNLSAPFFNVYLLDTLAIDLRWVTIYTSLQAGAHLIMLIAWGKLADRIGNRPILLIDGVLVALFPLLWLITGANDISLWLWFPLLHLLAGGSWAAIDLCTNNLQLGVAPLRHQPLFFAFAAAVAGISGALGTSVGGFLAEFADYGGIPGLFALSAIARLAALIPLVFVKEQGGQSLQQTLRLVLPTHSSRLSDTSPPPVATASSLPDMPITVEISD